MNTAANNDKGHFKKRLNKFTHSNEFLLELSIITTLLVCLNFWSHLPDLGINPIIGKLVAAIGILMMIGMVAFRFKWPLLVAMVGLMLYMGVSHLQTNESIITADTQNHPTKENSLGLNTHYLTNDSIK